MVCSDCNNESIGKQTETFVYRKMSRFVPIYMFALLSYVTKDWLTNKSLKSIFENLFYSIPSCLLLGHTGFDNKEIYQGGYYVGVSWYISALMMMFIIYPFLCKNYDICTKVLAPTVLVASLYINISVLGIPIVGGRLYPVIPFAMGIIVGDISITAVTFIGDD